MKKNNFWNRIFHKKEVALNKERLLNDIKLVDHFQDVMISLDGAENLRSLMMVHKFVYRLGFTDNLGSDKFGMFRCESIAEMTADQVFLGGIQGIVTKSIDYWEQQSDDILYLKVLGQYRSHLRTNIKYMVNKAKKEIKEYELCGYRLN